MGVTQGGNAAGMWGTLIWVIPLLSPPPIRMLQPFLQPFACPPYQVLMRSPPIFMTVCSNTAALFSPALPKADQLDHSYGALSVLPGPPQPLWDPYAEL